VFTPQIYFPCVQIQEDGTCEAYGAEENCIQDFDWNTRKKRLTGCPRYRWEDDMKTYLKVGRDGVNWINLAQQRDNLRTPAKPKKIPCSKIGREFIECLRNSDTLPLSCLFRSCKSKD
jgi:hypothetical protein